ncbi:MAG: hypothetical protein IT322_12420 [Anaerolineae bacterium]|nr:hypothetical protein [Anaerolineae bacterium]
MMRLRVLWLGWIGLLLLLTACGSAPAPEPTRGAFPTPADLPSRPRGEVIGVSNAAGLQPLAVLRTHPTTVNRIVFSPNSRRMITIDADGTAVYWDMDKYQIIHTFGGEKLREVFFSADPTIVAGVSVTNMIFFASAEDGKVITSAPGNEDGVYRAVINQAGTQLATGGVKGDIMIWDTAQYVRIALIPATAPGNVRALSYSPDGQMLASIHNTAESLGTDTIRIWSIPEGKQRYLLHGWTPGLAQKLVFSPDNARFAVGLASPPNHDLDKPFTGIQIHDATTGTLLFAVNESGLGADQGLTFSPNGGFLASTGQASVVFVVDQEGKVIAKLPGHAQGTSWVGFSPNGELLLTTAIRQKSSIYLWRTDGFKGSSQDFQRGVIAPENNGVLLGAWSPDGKLIVLADGSGALLIWGIPGAV